MILVDTNVWSAQSKPNAERAVLGWLNRHADDLLLSTIVIAELQAGIENPKAAGRRDALTRWLDDLETIYSEQILHFDVRSAHFFGRLIAQRKLQQQQTKLLDTALAAQALAHDCPVATRNTRDFAWTGVQLIDPWQA
ncbi:PIN domain-containing protein [Sphingomonas bacterium]|uniref:PIN domain-containing protein n=1 Tax=Sphingomonas bacterium TaxID=1895847 RepID=UPI001577378D|nr:PIN domain-containing protein [Sphingomonas bacterium]